MKRAFHGLPGCRMIPRSNPQQQDVNQWAVVKEITKLLKDEELFHDVTFYSPEQWRALGERGKGIYFAMTFEGPLYNVFNGHGSVAQQNRVMQRLNNTLQKYGLYFEQGEAWNALAYAA